MRIRSPQNWDFFDPNDNALFLLKPKNLDFSFIQDQGIRFLSVFRPSKCDLDPISKMIGLEFLELTGCKLDTNFLVKTLKNINSLKSLRMDVNCVDDLSALNELENEKIHLQNLDLSFNKILDVSPLVHLKIDKLILDRNKIKDISPLPKIVGLEHVSFDYNQVKSLQPILLCPTITNYSSQGNPIRDGDNTRYLFLR